MKKRLCLLFLLVLSSCQSLVMKDKELIDNYYTKLYSKEYIVEEFFMFKDRIDFVAPYELEGLSNTRMIEYSYSCDTNYLIQEEIETFQSTKSMFTINYPSLTKNEKIIDLNINAKCDEIQFDKTYSQKIKILPYYNYTANIYFLLCKNQFDTAKQMGDNGFQLFSEYISSGHKYTQTTVILDFENKCLNMKKNKFHKDVYGTHDHHNYNLEYYFDERALVVGTDESKENIAYDYYINKLNDMFKMYEEYQYIHEDINFTLK